MQSAMQATLSTGRRLQSEQQRHVFGNHLAGVEEDRLAVEQVLRIAAGSRSSCQAGAVVTASYATFLPAAVADLSVPQHVARSCCQHAPQACSLYCQRSHDSY
jgi:hypothetical protein